MKNALRAKLSFQKELTLNNSSLLLLPVASLTWNRVQTAFAKSA